MQEVDVKALPLELLASVLTPERARRSAESAAHARAVFGDRTIWHVNATAHGGGVAEMLQTLLAYGRGAGIDNRWLVLDGDAGFFAITKRLHNLLHGDPGDGGRLGTGERATYERVVRANVDAMVRLIDSPRLRAAPRPPDRRHGRRPARTRGTGRVALPRRARHPQRRDRRGVGVPQAVHRTRRRVRVLAPGVRAGLGGPAAGRHHRAVDRSVLGQEPRARPTDGRRDPGDRRTGRRRRARRTRVLRTARRHAGHAPAPHRPDRRRRTAAPRRTTHRAGQPLGPTQGHGRCARRVRQDGRRRSRRRPPHARRSGRVGGDRRSGRRRGARRLPCPLADRARVDPPSGAPRVHPDGRRRRERDHRQCPPAPRLRRRAEEPRGGLRADGHRSDVEGANR